MSLENDLRAALATAIAGSAEVGRMANSVFATAPADAVAPFVAVGEMLSVDWSTKDLRGRELRVSVRAEDAAPGPERASDLAEAAINSLAGLPLRLGAWQLGPVVHLRSLARPRRGGGWVVEADLRVRAMRNP
jgi:hypothetical protein